MVCLYIERDRVRERKVCLQYKITIFTFVLTNTEIYFIW